jgi:DNA-binding NtrC family response regulator
MSFDDAYRAAHPGLVVIFAPGGGPSAADVKIQSLLARAGHKVVVAHDAVQLKSALAAGKPDIVLTSFSEAAVAGADLPHWPIGPVILPVLATATKQEKSLCQLTYSCNLKRDDKPEQFVAVVNATMNDRAKALSVPRRHGN